MSEIEKLYENVGIKQRCNIYPTFYGYAKHPHKKCEDCVEWKYPPFTTEKLVNLVMFLINKGNFGIKKGSVNITFENFSTCVAGLINKLWQSLTEEEKEQIRGILE